MMFLVGLLAREAGYVVWTFLTPILVLVGISGVVAVGSELWMQFGVEPREIRAGYTTVGGHVEIAQVDPRSNRVIRLAGENLDDDPDVRRERLVLVRAAAEEERRSKGGA
ncbi:hypothetical protein [Myceligenerans indicum]|uniref:PH domain-containing protein n=1 Tax=Myceligenerans indicum TaxID=2593663 RepID=A0ABS1LI72_9MICO|nr:hypothetical protein [Myceligenerans indicum]MBL0885892.1 hypothetical protein [Myceligenerans indicum]